MGLCVVKSLWLLRHSHDTRRHFLTASFQVKCVIAQARSTYVFDMLKVCAPLPLQSAPPLPSSLPPFISSRFSLSPSFSVSMPLLKLISKHPALHTPCPPPEARGDVTFEPTILHHPQPSTLNPQPSTLILPRPGETALSRLTLYAGGTRE
jgi:hypothetical protein